MLFKRGAERRVKRGEECLSDECPSGECFANVCDVYEELREVKIGEECLSDECLRRMLRECLRRL